jgi:hypothetical protein
VPKKIEEESACLTFPELQDKLVELTEEQEANLSINHRDRAREKKLIELLHLLLPENR